MKRIACFIFIVAFTCQAKAQVTTKTYTFRHLSGKNNMLADYIQLVFENDSIVKGTYYGNEDDYHYKADIQFKGKDDWNNTRFSIFGYKFSKEIATPFDNIEYSYFLKVEKLPAQLKQETDFFGVISDENLDLNRIPFVQYDSASDKMLFTLEKTE